jgi:hypothetical protein
MNSYYCLKNDSFRHFHFFNLKYSATADQLRFFLSFSNE